MNGLILVFFVAVSCVRIAKKLYFFNVDILLFDKRHIVCADAFPVIQKLVSDKSLLPFLFIDFVFALNLSHLSPSPFSYTTYHNAFYYIISSSFCVLFLCIIISNADNRTCSKRREATSLVIKTSTLCGCIFNFLVPYQKGLKFFEKNAILIMLN